ncbi:MAG: hypothetical protein M1541_14725 [Acidobacteria bacterium]|nr:hypothetical protein [Acidobacteriota bacterium]
MKLCALILSVALFASAQAPPEATYIVNSASYAQWVSPESLATIFGKNLSVGEYVAGALPLPVKLGETEVFSCIWQYAFAKECPGGQPCCVQAELLYVGPNQINLRMPASTMSASSETRDIVVRVSGNAVKSLSAASVGRAAPGIFEMGWDCGIDPRRPDTSPCGISWTKRGENQTKRGAITDQAGNLITAKNPARVSQYYTLWLTGLGKITNGKTIGTVNLMLYDVPVYSYTGTTSMYSTVTWAGHSPQFPGLDQINFKLPDWLMGGKPEWNGYPPMHPCGDYSMELTLSVSMSSYGSENSVQIPVVVKTGDVPCVAK